MVLVSSSRLVLHANLPCNWHGERSPPYTLTNDRNIRVHTDLNVILLNILSMGSRSNKVFKAPWASGGGKEEEALPDSQTTPFSMSQRWIQPFTYDNSKKGNDMGNGRQNSRQQSEGSQVQMICMHLRLYFLWVSYFG
jgi:hypothetical protein